MQCNNVLYIKFNQSLHVFKNSKYDYINEKKSSNSKYEIRKTKVYIFLFMKCKNQSSNLTL